MAIFDYAPTRAATKIESKSILVIFVDEAHQKTIIIRPPIMSLITAHDSVNFFRPCIVRGTCRILVEIFLHLRVAICPARHVCLLR